MCKLFLRLGGLSSVAGARSRAADEIILSRLRGGPCHIHRDADAHPECTDNFQIKPFELDKRRWESVEQAFQALKFTSKEVQESIRAIKPLDGESSWDYGLRLHQAGQIRDPSYREDWDIRSNGTTISTTAAAASTSASKDSG